MNFWKRLPNLVHNSLALLFERPMASSSWPMPLKASSMISKNSFLYPLVSRNILTLESLHKYGPHRKTKKKHKILNGNPFLKGIILRTVIKKPRKPNSANRKCVYVKLSNGKETIAYVPGVGHNLQEHQFVLVNGRRLKDVPGVKIRCVRGVYDLPLAGK